MCAWLGVSRSGYYEWRHQPASATAERRERLKAMIATIFHAHPETYGYRRVHAVLQRRGKRASPGFSRRWLPTLAGGPDLFSGGGGCGWRLLLVVCCRFVRGLSGRGGCEVVEQVA
ncbi:IS3 family transposase [Actinoallomurus acanthiterrae]